MRGDPLAVWGRCAAAPAPRPDRGSAGGAAGTHPGCTPGRRGLRGAMGQPGDPSRGRSRETRQRGRTSLREGPGQGEPGGRPARQAGCGSRHWAAGHRRVQGWQPLQAPSPRDPLPSPWSWLPGHVPRAVTQDPSRVGHAAATVLRVSIIFDEGALTITSHRPLPDTCTQALAAPWSSRPCTGGVLCPGAVQADGTDAPLLRPHSPPHWWRPWVWREDPRPGPDAPASCLQPPSSSRFSRGPGLREGGATGRDVPRPGLGLPGHQGHPGQHPPCRMVQEAAVERGKDSTRPRSAELRGKKGTGRGGGGRKRSWGRRQSGSEETKPEPCWALRRARCQPGPSEPCWAPEKGHAANQGPVNPAGRRGRHAANQGPVSPAGRRGGHAAN